MFEWPTAIIKVDNPYSVTSYFYYDTFWNMITILSSTSETYIGICAFKEYKNRHLDPYELQKKVAMASIWIC